MQLVLMKGPPGSGKSTLARALGRHLRWPLIDKDAIRDVLPDHLGGLSYAAMLRLAEQQLSIGLSVIADSPLGYSESYIEAVRLADVAGARAVVVECRCSDETEWRRRIERRQDTGLAAHHAVTWSRVEAFYDRTAGDPYAVDVPCLVIDTVEPVDVGLRRTVAWLEQTCQQS